MPLLFLCVSLSHRHRVNGLDHNEVVASRSHNFVLLTVRLEQERQIAPLGEGIGRAVAEIESGPGWRPRAGMPCARPLRAPRPVPQPRFPPHAKPGEDVQRHLQRMRHIGRDLGVADRRI